MSFFPAQQSLNNKYQVNLASLMRLCSNNYLLLIKLLASNVQVGQKRVFFISDNLAYSITINEVTKYTTLINFQQTATSKEMATTKARSEKGNGKTNNKILNNKKLTTSMLPCMVIRLYHDAKMAEVISTQHIKQIKPKYSYPNKQMHQQDEKHQTNQFLHDWLHLCLALGQVKLSSSWEN